jgi:hypothetical protein
MFDLFYSQYVAECEALGVAPLPPGQLIALIGTLVDGVGAGGPSTKWLDRSRAEATSRICTKRPAAIDLYR